MARSIDTAKPMNMKFIEQIKERTALKESADVVNVLLIDMYLRPQLSTKELSRKVSLPIPVVSAIRHELKKMGLLINQNGTRLSKKGRIFVEQQLGWHHVDTAYYVKVQDSQSERASLKAELIEALRTAIVSRPVVAVEYDQAFATLETSVERALLLLEKQRLINHQLLFLGDDDLTSLAVALLLKKVKGSLWRREQLVVYEMSSAIISCIEQSSHQLGVSIDCRQVDFRQGEPTLFAHQFDSVFVDPPYTLPGLKLFLARAVAASKLGSGQIYLSFGAKEPSVELEIQQLVNTQNISIRTIQRGFNHYEGAAVIGGRSDLYELSVTATSYPLIPKESSYDQLIYTGELAPKLTRYDCQSCGKSYLVGNGAEVSTIQQLKEMGCSCQHRNFKRLEFERGDTLSNKAVGHHYLIELHGCPTARLTSVSTIENSMLAIVRKNQLNAVTHYFHQFEPWGVSGVVVLAESHFTLHTWPEINYAALDLFVCQELTSESYFFETIREAFSPQEWHYQKVDRGVN